MDILITNDDGINAKGLLALSTKFLEMGNVTIVAPNTQQSATSHSLTTTTPLRIQKHNLLKDTAQQSALNAYSINGSPADCVKFALLTLFKGKKPDLLLAGINHGRNTGINIMYSGTIAGATEGHLVGIPSFAVSVATHDTSFDCSAAADYAFDIVSNIMKHPDKNKFFININVPACSKEAIKGMKVVKGSNSYWEDEYEKRIDPFGKEYFWFNGSYLYDANDADTDDVVVDNNFVAITPIQILFTNQQQIDTIKYIETGEELVLPTPTTDSDDIDNEVVDATNAESESIADVLEDDGMDVLDVDMGEIPLQGIDADDMLTLN
ncbi:MAG: 5'/3'-nucleotidase SurE [Ignavibacteria bacterium]|jgi:5'-nucleotidase|nr:5'/3'-nucleotidase SurE [Ignavibacteria bacterium]